MFGYRARIGLVVPSSNTTNESEFWQWSPPGVSIHTARMMLQGVNEQELIDMADDVEGAVEQLNTADVDAIVFGCTTGSLVKGMGYDKKIQTMIEDKTGVPCIATSTAIMHAFDALGVTSLAIATPYTEQMNSKEVDFLEENGYMVTGITGLGLEPNVDIGHQEPSTAYRLSSNIDDPEADAVFISCTNFRTVDIVDMLENDLEKPVISSNSATLWAVLNLLGVDSGSVSSGQLFRESLPAQGATDG